MNIGSHGTDKRTYADDQLALGKKKKTVIYMRHIKLKYTFLIVNSIYHTLRVKK